MIHHFYSGLGFRERLLFGAAAVIVGAALLSQGVLRPYRACLEVLDRRIAERESKLSRYEALAAQKSAIEKKIAALSPARSSARHSVNPVPGAEERSVRLLRETESLARSSSLVIRHLRPAGGGMEMEAGASLDKIIIFLRKLHHASFPIQVRKYHISAGDRDAELTLRLTLESESY